MYVYELNRSFGFSSPLCYTTQLHVWPFLVNGGAQWQQNRNMIGEAGMRGFEAADYPRQVSMCEGQELGGGGSYSCLDPG